MLLGVLLPTYENRVLSAGYVKILEGSINSAVEHYYAYDESESQYELEMMVCDLYMYHRVLNQLEEIQNLEKNSTEVMAVVNLLQSDRESYEGLEDLESGLLFLKEDIYSDAGYSMLVSFYNKNIND